MNLDRPLFLTPHTPPVVELAQTLARRAGVSWVGAPEEKAGAWADTQWAAAQRADATPRIAVLPEAALSERAERLEFLARGTVVRWGEGALTEVHATLDGRAQMGEAAEAVRRLVERSPVAVALGARSYRVDVAVGGADAALADALTALSPTRVVLVTDEVVAPLVLPQLTGALGSLDDLVRVVLPSGESAKKLSSVETILRAAVDAAVDRSAVVVGVGGGVVTDMAGFAAAILLRGVRWVAVPTTVLSMVDASVGGKTGVDLGLAKNAVGAFHQPSRVVIDPSLAATESPRGVRSGLAEVLKSGLIGDPVLYGALVEPAAADRLVIQRDAGALREVIRRSISVKAQVVSRDERESGERAHLNLGHTLGHALEAEGGFVRLSHGEAVSLGLVAALRIGVHLGVTPRALEEEAKAALGRLGLPADLEREPIDRALAYVGFDKKKIGGKLRFVLVRAPGSVEVVKVDPGDLPALLAMPRR